MASSSLSNGRHHQHRAEYLVLGNEALVGNIGEDGDRQVIATCMIAAEPRAAGKDAPALFHSALDHAENAVDGGFGNHRAEHCARIERIAAGHKRRHGAKSLQIGIVDTALDQQAGAVDTALTIGRNRTGHTELGRAHQIGIVEHDHRRLAAQFQPDRLEGLRGAGQNLARQSRLSR